MRRYNADIYEYFIGISDYMCDCGKFVQEFAEYHINLYVVQSGDVYYMDSFGIAGFSDYGSCGRRRRYQRIVFCYLKENTRYGKNGTGRGGKGT